MVPRSLAGTSSLDVCKRGEVSALVFPLCPWHQAWGLWSVRHAAEVVSALPAAFPESQDTRGHRSELNCRHVKSQGVGLFSVAPLAELNSVLSCKVL